MTHLYTHENGDNASGCSITHGRGGIPENHHAELHLVYKDGYKSIVIQVSSSPLEIHTAVTTYATVL